MKKILIFSIILIISSCIQNAPTAVVSVKSEPPYYTGKEIKFSSFGTTIGMPLILNYEWQISSAPIDGTTKFDNSNNLTASFTPGKAGKYVITLNVYHQYNKINSNDSDDENSTKERYVYGEPASLVINVVDEGKNYSLTSFKFLESDNNSIISHDYTGTIINNPNNNDQKIIWFYKDNSATDDLVDISKLLKFQSNDIDGTIYYMNNENEIEANNGIKFNDVGSYVYESYIRIKDNDKAVNYYKLIFSENYPD